MADTNPIIIRKVVDDGGHGHHGGASLVSHQDRVDPVLLVEEGVVEGVRHRAVRFPDRDGPPGLQAAPASSCSASFM